MLDRVKRIYHAARSNKIWLPEHVEAFTRAAPAELVRALMLAMHTGRRQGDLLRLPWPAYDGERITLRQGKTGVAVSIKCTAHARRFAEGQERPADFGDVDRPRLAQALFRGSVATGVRGGGHQRSAFPRSRGTAITMLAEAGATVPEIAAVTGHSLNHASRILEVYLSRTRSLADAAIMKLDERRNRP